MYQNHTLIFITLKTCPYLSNYRTKKSVKQLTKEWENNALF